MGIRGLLLPITFGRAVFLDRFGRHAAHFWFAASAYMERTMLSKMSVKPVTLKGSPTRFVLLPLVRRVFCSSP